MEAAHLSIHSAPMQAPHGAVAQPRTPATPAQPRSCGNSPLLWMQAPGSGERQQSLQLQQQQHSAASTPFQAMQAMQLEAGMVAQQRAMIRQQLQAQQVRASIPFSSCSARSRLRPWEASAAGMVSLGFLALFQVHAPSQAVQ